MVLRHQHWRSELNTRIAIWLTKRNPIIDWRGKSLEIRTSTGESNWRESEVTAKIRGPQGKPEVNNSWPAMNKDLVV